MATTKYSLVKLIGIPAAITFLFCLAAIFNISPLFRGPAPYPPEWQWGYQFVNTLYRIWAPGLVGVLGLLGILYFDNKKKEKTFLFFILCFTFLLELSVLYFSRAGIGVLLERIINPGISGYFTTALSIKNVNLFFSTFESSVAHFPMRAADHPPFAVLFFSLILYISHFLPALFPFVDKISLHHSDMGRIWTGLLPYQRVAALVSSVLIPFLSTLTLIPLYFFTKLYYDEKTAVRACFLYSAIPSLCLFLPLNDTFLGIFGVLGLLGVLLRQKSKLPLQKIGWYFLSGIIFAIGVFFSVSMVVPVIIALLFLYASDLRKRENALRLLGLVGGLGVIPILLFLFYHFNSLTAFIKITSLQAKRSYLPWVFYNLYDFFLFSGIPLGIYAFLLLKKQIGEKVKRDMLVISFFIVIFLLDISGFSRAETGRIWMPYMPFLASFAAAFLTKEKKFTSHSFAIVIFIQLVQLLVMQEFWVTLW